ncbi:MAG: helix-turn-helix transcriptional regulator [Ruminococcaceae bacterium]|nr:helix-turn-helix transcriptional regulator [Oscillospiraceae bacterium]
MDFHYKDEKIKLGLNIAYYRKLNGFTQESLAEKANISINHIAKVETAQVGLSMDKLFAIAEALEVPASKLLEFRE